MSLSSINGLPILLLFAAPFMLGGILLLAAFRTRRKRVRVACASFASVLLAAFAFAVISFAPYVWASL